MPATAPIATTVPAAAVGTAVPAGTGAAALTGRVVDQSKALIPGVTVTVTNTAGSQVARAVTDSGGTFSIPPLAAGTYLVLADLPGFQPIRLGVQIVPGSPHHLDLVMRVGTVTTSVNLGFSIAQPVLSTRTDSSGRYRLDVPAGSYVVAAGYMDPPTFFPGVADALSATPVNVPAKTAVDKIDFVIPVPPPRQTVAGIVAAQRGVPLAGAEVTLRSAVPTTGTMPGIPNQVLTTGPEGTFAFRDVLPGTYALEALVSGIGSTVRGITVADSPIANLDFAFSVAVLRGRLLWEDGKPFSDSVAGLRLVAETVDNPNILAGTHLAIFPDGMFGGPLKTGTYRIHLQSLPAGYSIVSMTTGSTNLLADALTVKETVVVDVEVRLAWRSTPAP
jgi:hypothetical protein